MLDPGRARDAAAGATRAGGRGVSDWWRRAEPAREVAAVPEEHIPDSRLAYWGLLAFTFFVLVSPQNIIPALAPLRLALVSAATTVLALVAYRLMHGQPLTINTREIWLGGVLGAWSIATIPMSLWPGGSLAFFVDIYLKSLVTFWLLANVLNTTARLRRMAWVLTLLAVPLAATGVQNFLSGEFLPEQRKVRRIFGYDAALTGNPNDLALMLNLLLPIAVALLMTRPRGWVRACLMGFIALDVVAIVVTFSRAGFLTLTVVALTYVWKLRGRPEWKWGLLALMLGLASLPFLPAGYEQRLATVMDANSDRTGSAQNRRDDSVAAIRWIGGHPLIGAGIGQDVLALNEERGAAWKAVHNVYLQYAVELGLPGLVLFVMLLVSALRSAALAARRAAGDPARAELFHLATGLHVSLIAFTFAALFYPVAYHFYFYYVAGLALAIKTVADRHRPPEAIPEWAAR